MLKTCKKTQSAGFSLLELLLVVAVGAILILAGLGAYRLVSEGSNTNRATQQLNTLKQQTQQAFAGQGAYGTATLTSLVATLDNMKALPSDMAVSGTTIRNAFGTATTITTGATAATLNTFIVTFPAVPVSSCIKLGQLFTPGNANDLARLAIGATNIDRGAAATAYTLAAITTACGTAATNMAWTFN